MNPLQAGDDLVHLHALDQPGHALRVAGAAADELNVFDHVVVVYINQDLLGAGSVGFVLKHGVCLREWIYSYYT